MNIFAFGVILLMLAGTGPVGAPKYGVTTGTKLNLRAEPSTKAKNAGRLKDMFTIVEVLEKTDVVETLKISMKEERHPWIKIRHRDRVAYVFGSGLKLFATREEAIKYARLQNARNAFVAGTYVFVEDDEDHHIELKLVLRADGSAQYTYESSGITDFETATGKGKFVVQGDNVHLHVVSKSRMGLEAGEALAQGEDAREERPVYERTELQLDIDDTNLRLLRKQNTNASVWLSLDEYGRDTTEVLLTRKIK